MDPDPDSDPDPAIFVIDLQDASKKLKSHKIVGIKVFLTILAWLEKDPDPEPYLCSD
jgi:hypothetical protein